MPVQKGKKRKRVRNRGERDHSTSEVRATAVPVAKSVPTRAGRKGGWQLPPWANLVFGALMLGAGLFFFLSPQKGMSMQTKAILLVMYISVAGFYLFRAYRGYRGPSG